jgi:hypothetical protein
MSGAFDVVLLRRGAEMNRDRDPQTTDGTSHAARREIICPSMIVTPLPGFA